MFEKIILNHHFLGHLFRFENGFAFFGSKQLAKEDLKSLFPHLSFHFVKQVHGNRVIEASAHLEEADGQWTERENTALVIQTADCIPLMIHSPTRIYALHAGWRGVEQNILDAALSTAPSRPPFLAVVGPHIHKESFEVGEDVAQRLFSSDPQRDPSVLLPHPEEKKNYVDLKKILHHQLQHFSSSAKYEALDVNTFVSPDHFSYRKNGPQAGRLLSFIVKTRTIGV